MVLKVNSEDPYQTSQQQNELAFVIQVCLEDDDGLMFYVSFTIIWDNEEVKMKGFVQWSTIQSLAKSVSRKIQAWDLFFQN